MVPLTSFALARALYLILDSSDLSCWFTTHLWCANTHLRLRDCDLLGANCKILFESLMWKVGLDWIWIRSRVIDEFEFDFCKVNEFELEFSFFKVNEFEVSFFKVNELEFKNYKTWMDPTLFLSKSVNIRAYPYFILPTGSFAGKAVRWAYRISDWNKLKMRSYANDFTHSIDWGVNSGSKKSKLEQID